MNLVILFIGLLASVSAYSATSGCDSLATLRELQSKITCQDGNITLQVLNSHADSWNIGARVVKPHYSSHSPFSADGRFLVLDRNPGDGKFRILRWVTDSTSSTKRLEVHWEIPVEELLEPATRLRPKAKSSSYGAYRWSRLYPHLLYFFPRESTLVIALDVDKRTILYRKEPKYNPAFPVRILSAKVPIVVRGKEELVALIGAESREVYAQRNSKRFNDPEYEAQLTRLWIYFLNLSTMQRVSAPFEITTSCGASLDFSCKFLYWDSLRVSPDGSTLAILYLGNKQTRRPWRLLSSNMSRAIEPTADVITPMNLQRLAPIMERQGCSVCLPYDPREGFLPVNFGHPIFVADPNGSSWLIGDGRERFTRAPTSLAERWLGASRLVGFHVETQRFVYLDDDSNSVPSHITAAINRPGIFFVSYLPGRGHLSGKIVQFFLNDKDQRKIRRQVLASHRTVSKACGLECQPHISSSMLGDKLVFPTNWGADGRGAVVTTILLDVPPRHGE